MSQSSTPLDYAPSPPGFWRRHRRLIAALALLFPLILLTNRYRDDIVTRSRRMYWYRQCAHFTIPPDALLKETDTTRAAALLASRPDDYRSVTYSTGTIAVYFPRCLREYATVEPRSLGLRGIIGSPILFLHELHTPYGAPRLVAVSAEWTNGYDMHILMDRVVLPPPRVFESLNIKSPATGFAYSGPYIEVTFSRGALDPADPTHFSIPFTVPDRLKPDHPLRHGVLDGYLRDDDTIHFKVRDPATTQNL
jgi:hypothetical protein